MGNKSFQLEGNKNNAGSFSCKGYDGDREFLDISTSESTDPYEIMIATEFLKQGMENKNNDVKLILEHHIIDNGKIPVLYCYQKSDKLLPVIIFAHGMFGDKIIDMHRGIRLAQEGFFVVLPDARLHGERIVDNYAQYFCENDKITNCKRFFTTIKDSSEDISSIMDNLEADPRIDLNRIGMSGISMGGYITFATVAKDNRIKVAAPMISSPDWSISTQNMDYEEYDEELKELLRSNNPINNFNKISSIPLLVQNGIEDKTISINGVRKLDKLIKKEHGEIDERYSLIEYPSVGHEIPEIMIDRIIQWFKKYL